MANPSNPKRFPSPRTGYQLREQTRAQPWEDPLKRTFKSGHEGVTSKLSCTPGTRSPELLTAYRSHDVTRFDLCVATNIDATTTVPIR